MTRTSCLLTVAVVAGAWAMPRSATALINLELRPANQVVNVGDPADLELYAVSDSTGNQLLSAADVIITWDTTYLDLLGASQVGAAAPTSFFPLADPYGNINGGVSPPTGGIGLLSILAGLGSPVSATPSGTLITTFVIDAIAPTPGTLFSIVLNGGTGGKTTVYGGPNIDVTGTLSVANITILPEPSALMLLAVGAAGLTRTTRRRRA